MAQGFGKGFGVVIGVLAGCAVALILLVAGCGACAFIGSRSAPTSTDFDSFDSYSSPLTSPDIVTKYEYDQLRNGMSYREAVAIIGAEGEHTSSHHMDGVEGVMESVDTVMYTWSNGDGSNMNAMFQNDRLITKAQFGLN